MDDVKVWTVEEANEAIPRVARLVRELRSVVEGTRFALEQVRDLERLHGKPALHAPEHPAHEEYARHVAAVEAGQATMRGVAQRFDELGAEVKDPLLGLVDFPTLRGRDLVYLCWREGEAEITHWHGVTTGFAGRKPLDDLVRASGR